MDIKVDVLINIRLKSKFMMLHFKQIQTNGKRNTDKFPFFLSLW